MPTITPRQEGENERRFCKTCQTNLSIEDFRYIRRKDRPNQRCYKCHNCEKDYDKNRSRSTTKEKCLTYKTSQTGKVGCEVCGYNRCNAALQFHHIEPGKKDFGISSAAHRKSWDDIEKELDKCMVVCGNCHTEIHNGVIDLEGKDLLTVSLTISTPRCP